ncbi:hypothetical protein AciM339_0900 [Aciduliprofundum sp. MAR08-339]|nr:hypothetical protein AciM339_0900 [Aciduliprofundum sp. MAR08-339]
MSRKRNYPDSCLIISYSHIQSHTIIFTVMAYCGDTNMAGLWNVHGTVNTGGFGDLVWG